jgi:hypothetical protein
MFADFESAVRDYHEKGIDIHIMTYRKAPTSSLAVLPNFRGEKLYTPIWVETFASVNDIPNASTMKTHLHAPEFRKQEMKDLATKMYEALNLTGPCSH